MLLQAACSPYLCLWWRGSPINQVRHQYLHKGACSGQLITGDDYELWLWFPYCKYSVSIPLCTYWTHFEAPAEAEAELAAFNSCGIINAVLTDDVDVLVFGATHIIWKYVLLLELLSMPHWFLPDSGHSCGIRWNPEESNLAETPAKMTFQGDEYSCRMMSFLISRRNGPWNGQKGMQPECNNQNRY